MRGRDAADGTPHELKKQGAELFWQDTLRMDARSPMPRRLTCSRKPCLSRPERRVDNYLYSTTLQTMPRSKRFGSRPKPSSTPGGSTTIHTTRIAHSATWRRASSWANVRDNRSSKKSSALG